MGNSLPQLITFIFTTVGLSSIILIVAIRDFKNKTAKWFLLFASLVLIYVVTGFIDDLQSNLTVVLWMIRGELFIANFIPPAFLAFSLAFSGYKYGKKWIRQIFYYFLIPLSVIAFLPGTVIDVVKNKYGTNVDHSGPLYYVTLVYFLVVLTYAFTILYKNAKTADRVTKLQTALITFGLGSTVAINLVVVFLFPFFNLADVGNLIGAPSIIILAASLVYAVIGQHMFNIRALIVRTIGFF